MDNILTIRNISKSYGSLRALQDISFTVPKGSVFGILGPNGSGKTTLLGILLNVLNRQGGSYEWIGGLSPEAARKKIGALLETPNFYHYLSAADNLKITAAIKQCDEATIPTVLTMTGLLERQHSKFSTFSLGMKQRLAIANALLGHPEVLVLDEPTNGLDPAGIAEIRELIRTLHQQGLTIIMASHLLDEVEKTCTHVAVMKTGRLLATGTVAELLQSEDLIEVGAADADRLEQCLRNMPGIRSVSRNGPLLQLMADAAVAPQAVNAYCAGQGITLQHLLLKKKSLESKFIELTA